MRRILYPVVIVIVFVFCAAGAAAWFDIQNVLAFVGPIQSAGTGSGAIGVDASNNLSIGTPTPSPGVKLFLMGATNDSTAHAFSVVNRDSIPILGARNDGFVGIGASAPAPQAKLDVGGGTDILFRLSRIGATHPTIFREGTDGALVIQNSGLDTLTLKGGNVGVGDASPAALLTVGSGDVFQVNTSGNLARINNVQYSWPSVQGGASAVLTNDGAGNLTWSAGGNISGTGVATRIAFFTAGTALGTDASLYWDNVNKRVGIGTTGLPQEELHIYQGTAANNPRIYLEGDAGINNSPGISFGFDSAQTRRSIIRVNAAGALGTNLHFWTKPDSGTGVLERMRIDESGNVGIGTETPSYKLDVAGSGATTARFGTGASDTVVIGGGAGKIDVGTVDPIYTIGGKQYATYLPAMTGVKEETTGVVQLTEINGYNHDGISLWSHVIDFNQAPIGSDLWLFVKTTNLKKYFDRMTVLLTSGFDGRVWYEKDHKDLQLKIFATMTNDNNNDAGGQKSLSSLSYPLEVSYRLTAPRFDAAQWSNVREHGGEQGFIIDE